MAETDVAFKIPSVLWAQRNDLVLITVQVEDAHSEDIRVDANSLHVSCKAGTDTFKVDMEFFKEINPEFAKHVKCGRSIEFFIQKKEAGPYWPRLLKDSKKQHWLHTDFNKWRDEDDSDDEDVVGEEKGLNEMLASMGGGMGGLGGMGDGMDGFQADEEEDSDDEPIPDLEEAEPKAETEPMPQTEGRSE